jgi:hypothetical protein
MEEPSQSPSGWSFLKVVGVLIGFIGMAGFGVCTLCGVVISLDGNMDGIWPFVLAGGVMTFLSVWLIRVIFRKVREARDAGNRTP